MPSFLSSNQRFVATLAMSAFIVVMLMATACDSSRSKKRNARKTSKDHRPHIVLIYADDLDCETLFGTWPEQTPEGIRFKAIREMTESGLRFNNFHVTTPVCGPSRACLYSGQYSHHNQCRVNNPEHQNSMGFSGGYGTFNPKKELACWMQSAGYETAHVGKYLHEGFVPVGKQTWVDMVPPGWDHFHASMGSKYYDFVTCQKGSHGMIRYTTEYRTDVEVDTIQKVLTEYEEDESTNKPLFLCWTPLSPHMPGNDLGMIADRHKDLFTDALPPDMEQRINATVRNQPPQPALIAKPDAEQRKALVKKHRDRLRSLQALDEGIEKIRNDLKQRGMLENTIFILTSDHGFRVSHHRHFGKRLPYDRVTKVPFIVTGPGVPKNQQCHALLANIDIAPTMVALAEGTPDASIDGRSFKELLFKPADELDPPRPAILLEHWGLAVSHSSRLNATYNSMRTANHVYTEWAVGGNEFYDLIQDPDQMNNRFPDLDDAKKQQLTTDLRKLRRGNLPPFLTATKLHEMYEIDVVSASFKPIELTGLVECDLGTKSVQLELSCDQNGMYWDGKRWVKEPARVTADLIHPGGAITGWSWFLNTSHIAFQQDGEMPLQNITVNLIGTDLQGTQSEKMNDLKFKLAIDNPETWIDQKTIQFQQGLPIEISGRASDNRNMGRVTLLVQDQERALFWDGDNWVKERSVIRAETRKNRDETGPGDHRYWSYTLTAPIQGKVLVGARAFDRDGNFDAAIPFCEILPVSSKEGKLDQGESLDNDG